MQIKEIRELGINSRIQQYGKENIADRILRLFSIYFTWVFLRFGVSANEVTVLSMLIGTLGSTYFMQISILYGMILVYLYCILDASDGEIARITKTSNPKGLYFDYIATIIVMTTFWVWFPSINLGSKLLALIGFLWWELAINSTYMVFVHWRLKFNKKSQPGKQKWYVSWLLQSVNYVEAVTICLICVILGISLEWYLIYYGSVKFLLGSYNFYYEYKHGLGRICKNNY